MAEETYYSLLEISETATAAEIKAAYLRLIREVHPDRLANAPPYWRRQAEEKSKEINEANSVLSNHEKRRLYDAQLASYRGSRSANNGQTASQTSTKPKGSSTQNSQPSSRPQYGSGAGVGSAPPPSSTSQQHHGASSSVPPSGAHSQSASQPFASRMSAGQRFAFALTLSFFAFGMARLFWEATSTVESLFYFLLAASLLFGAACLYQNPIIRTFSALGISQPKQQLGVVIFVLLVLFGGKAANIYRDTHNAVTASPQPKVDSQNVAASSPEKLSEVLAAVGQLNNLDKDLLASVMVVEGKTDADEVRPMAAHLNELLVRYHDNLALALAAYKAGSEEVDKYHGIPPDHETRAFVSGVIHEFNTRVIQREAQRQPSNTAAFPPVPAGFEPASTPTSQQQSSQVNAQRPSSVATTPPLIPKGFELVTERPNESRSDPGSTPCLVENVESVIPAPEHGEMSEYNERFQTALRDFNKANYEDARREFRDLAAQDPERAAVAQFYIGQIAYQREDYSGAIKAFDSVLARHSDSPKAPAAQLKCGSALLFLKRYTEANQVLRLLMKNHPDSPESYRARELVNQTVTP